MKRILTLTILSLMLFSGFACARCKYDSRGHLIYDDTIRGRQRAAAQAKMEQQMLQNQTKFEAAAAAKITEESMEEFLNEPTPAPVLKSNYIQDRHGQIMILPQTTLKSNYIQDRNRQ